MEWRRWKMKGIFKRKGSDVWQGRFHIPKLLWDERERLRALGVSEIKATQGFALSTKEREQRSAERAYQGMFNAWEERFDLWKQILAADNGQENQPAVELNNDQVGALTGITVRQFFEGHKSEPQKAPIPGGEHLLNAVFHHGSARHSGVSSEDIDTLRNEIEKLSMVSVLPYIQGELESPATQGWRREILQVLSNFIDKYVKAMASHAADSTLRQRELVLEPESRQRVRTMVQNRLPHVLEPLGQRLEGFFDEPSWLNTFPTPETVSGLGRVESPVTLLEVIDEQESRGDSEIKGARKSAATFKAYRQKCSEFIEFSGDGSCQNVTRADMHRWRKHLQSHVKNGPKTINEKLNAVKAVVGWAIKQGVIEGPNPLHDLEHLEVRVASPEEKTYGREQAATILRAARKEAGAKRWVPWIMAYTGMRIAQACDLRKEDFLKKEGGWFIKTRSEANKNKREWYIPILPALVKEGLIEFVGESDSGSLFCGERSETNVRRWIKRVRPDECTAEPAHGFRHLHRDLTAGMRSEMVDYIRNGTWDRDGYGGAEIFLKVLMKEATKTNRLL